MSGLRDKTVLVTAAGQGIGRAIAHACRAEGARLVATDIDPEKLGEIGGGAIKCRLDVRDSASVAAAVAAAGHVDILMNCAGVVHTNTALTCTEAEFESAFELNVKAMWRVIQAVLPDMVARGDGSIVNIASVVSSIRGAPNRFTYGVTKAAVIGLTKSVAADYVTQGIRCNAICPGTVDSPSLQERLGAHGNYDASRSAFLARQPMGRFGRPEEIAALAVHLATAEFTTGQTHIIDGGWNI